MYQSEAIDALAAALIEAKKEFTPAKKALTAKVPTKQGGTYEYKYTDLARVIDATEEALANHGIVALQSPEGSVENQSVTVVTRLLHKSGQFMEGAVTLPAVGRQGYDAQSVGSAITYARRYALMAMLGIAPEDDDGAGASGGAEPQTQIVRKSEKTQVGLTSNGDPIFDENGEPVVERPAALPVQKTTPINGNFKTISEKQAKRFFAVAMSKGKSKQQINNFLSSLGYGQSEEIKPHQYDDCIAWAEAR